MLSLLHHGCFLCLQDVVSEDPGHGHLNGKLDPAAHCELQEKLSEPQLGKVTTMLQGLCKEKELVLLEKYPSNGSYKACKGLWGSFFSPLPLKFSRWV